jgi:tRNA-dihydrouridine synthase
LGSPQSYDEASNLVLQLGSNDPTRLQSCVQSAVENYDFREINLNCGCPAIDSGGATTYGASLMKDSALTGNLVESVRNGLYVGMMGKSMDRDDPPRVSVKCRIGVFDNVEDMRPMDDTDYNYLRKYISTIHDAGANHVILHARPAILSGLSPVKNRIAPQLDYQFVEDIASEFEGKVDITLNGGIQTLSQLQSLQKNAYASSSRISSHMSGRWCLRRPLDLIGIEELLTGKKLDSSLVTVAIEQYVDHAVRMATLPPQKRRFTTAELCLPLFLVVEQLRDDYDYEGDEEDGIEEPLLSYDDIESLYDIVQDGVAQLEDLTNNGKKKKNKANADDVNFKRLSSAFKSLVGTKVANKWKRNRAEL